MLVVGKRDAEAQVVSVRSRETGDQGAMTIEAFRSVLADAMNA